jgi:Conserved hypothetical protein 698
MDSNFRFRAGGDTPQPVSTRTVMAVGPALLAGIVLVVMAAITISYGIGRTLGLRQRVALLVACGNSICGNSAIAAVAPVIGADSADEGIAQLSPRRGVTKNNLTMTPPPPCGGNAQGALCRL